MTSCPTDASRAAVLAFLESRRSAATATLREPGPSEAGLRRFLAIAARVPDHGALTPWRFIVVRGEARNTLSRHMIDALASAPPEDRLLAEQKIKKVFTIAPVIVIVVSRIVAGDIPAVEQTLSAGAACMNLVTAAGAAGFGANWITGWAAYHPVAHAALQIGPEESVAGIILLGTTDSTQPDRARPDLDTIVSYWNPDMN
ncbi:MAG: nitroreductase family protein [Beijerinckiaceae bacterium]|nr:nitroreductase family protein [Beijerinckiaceae bacterium]